MQPARAGVAKSPPRTATSRTPIGYRVLHVIVPAETFNWAKTQANRSGLRFPEYIARFLEEAWPYGSPPASPLPARALAGPSRPTGDTRHDA